MENKIKETTEQLKNGTITKDEADKILLGLFGVSCSSFEQLTKANKELEKIIHECDKQKIEQELKKNLENIPDKGKRNYLDHLSSLFLNVLLNRVDELGQDAKEKSIEARRVIYELKSSLDSISREV